MRSLLLSIVSICLTAAPVSAQSITATLSGTIVDQTRQLVVGATVTLVDERTNDTRTAVSNDAGDFFFAAVRPGVYTVRVELQGFSPYQRTNTNLSANDHLSLGTIELRPGNVTEAVTVAAEGTPVRREAPSAARCSRRDRWR